MDFCWFLDTHKTKPYLDTEAAILLIHPLEI